MRVKIDKAIDAMIWHEAAKAAETTVQSCLFERGDEILAEVGKEGVVEDVAAVYSSYKIQVPWVLGDPWVSNVKKWVRDRITLEMRNGIVSIDVRTSVEGMTCEISAEQFVALKMMSE